MRIQTKYFSSAISLRLYFPVRRQSLEVIRISFGLRLRTFLPKLTLFIIDLALMFFQRLLFYSLVFISALQPFVFVLTIKLYQYPVSFFCFRYRHAQIFILRCGKQALRYFLGLTFVMIHTSHEICRAFYLSLLLNVEN